ncbi:MAG: transcription factor S [Candidatus Aenigmatarchaeota archaeon]
MQFCPKCGTIMVPVKKKNGAVLVCRKCGYQKHQTVKSVKISEGREKIKKPVILEKNTTTLPTTDKICPSCEHRTCYWWMQQTRGTDEPPTQFFKCVKCGHTWREYK